MEIIEINDTEFIVKDKIVSMKLATYDDNHFVYIYLTNGSVHQTGYFDTELEVIEFLQERL